MTIPLTVLESLMHLAIKGGAILVSLPLDSKVMGLIVKTEFNYQPDNEWVHANPLKANDIYDTYLIVGNHENVEEYVTNQRRGKAFSKLLDEYGDTEIRQWSEDKLDTEMSKLLSV